MRHGPFALAGKDPPALDARQHRDPSIAMTINTRPTPASSVVNPDDSMAKMKAPPEAADEQAEDERTVRVPGRGMDRGEDETRDPRPSCRSAGDPGRHEPRDDQEQPPSSRRRERSQPAGLPLAAGSRPRSAGRRGR